MSTQHEFQPEKPDSGATGEVRDKFEEWSHKLGDVEQYRRDLENKVTEKPLLSVAVALGAGYILGMLLGR